MHAEPNTPKEIERSSNMVSALDYARTPSRYAFLRKQVAKLLPPSDAACVLALMAVGARHD